MDSEGGLKRARFRELFACEILPRELVKLEWLSISRFRKWSIRILME